MIVFTQTLEETQRLIKELQESNEKSHKALSDKVSALEKWRWMLMGSKSLLDLWIRISSKIAKIKEDLGSLFVSAYSFFCTISNIYRTKQSKLCNGLGY